MQMGLAAAFLGGLLALLSPCSAMLLPSFFAYAFGSRRQLAGRTGLFTLGLITTLVPLGAFAGALGGALTSNRTIIVTASAILVIAFGAVQLSGLRIPMLRMRHSGGTSGVAVYLLGAAFGAAGGCAGPLLGAILTVAALGGDAAYGAVLLLMYALGMAVPVFFLALLWDAFDLGSRRWLRPRPVRIGRWQSTWTEVISGVLMIGIGILLLVTDGTAGLGGILTVGQQYDAELWAQDAGARLGNAGFVIAALAIAGLLALWWWAMVRRRANRTNAEV